MLEAIRIRKAGYAIRVTQEDFAKRYRSILNIKKRKDQPPKEICLGIFEKLNQNPQFKKVVDKPLKKWQIGDTKVFMKEDVRTVLEQAMGLAVTEQVIQMQRLARGHRARVWFRKAKAARAKLVIAIYRFGLR